MLSCKTKTGTSLRKVLFNQAMRKITLAIIVSLFIYTCKHDADKEISGPPDCDPDTTNVTYIKDIAPLIAAECGSNNSCHRQNDSDSEISLVSYDDVIAVAVTGQLLSSVTHDGNAEPMPYGGVKMSDCKINKKAWINRGLKEN